MVAVGGGKAWYGFGYKLVPFLRRHFLRIFVAFMRIRCAFDAHSLRILCAFYAFSELSAKCSGCRGLRTEPLGLAWLSTEMMHLLCLLRESTQNGTC